MVAKSSYILIIFLINCCILRFRVYNLLNVILVRYLHPLSPTWFSPRISLVRLFHFTLDKARIPVYVILLFAVLFNKYKAQDFWLHQCRKFQLRLEYKYFLFLLDRRKCTIIQVYSLAFDFSIFQFCPHPKIWFNYFISKIQ